MAGKPVYHLFFLMLSPRLELPTLANYNTFLESLISINLLRLGVSINLLRLGE